MRNYRPRSPLSQILWGKVHEMLYKIYIYENQYGFHQKHSTIDAVAKFTSHLVTSIEKKYSIVAVFLDLFNALDTIDHQKRI